MKTKLLIIIGAIFCICNALANPTLGSNSHYIYLNMNNQLQQTPTVQNSVDLASLRDDVLKNNKRYLVDFSEIKSAATLAKTKQQFYHSSAVSFNADRILISRYNNLLVYTPVNDNNLQAAVKSLDKLSLTDKSVNKDVQNTDIPMITFRINVVRPITPAECTFPTRFLDFSNPTKDMDFCKSPQIDLIYVVSLARSLKGPETPDEKRVYISLSNNNAGAGIRLNGKFNLIAVNDATDAERFRGINRYYNYSAIAQNYKFEIIAKSKNAILLDGAPENQNAGYKDSYSHTTTYGAGLKSTASPTSPSVGIDASVSYAHTHRFDYDTQDYAIKRSGARRSNNVTFEWKREQFVTADSLLDDHHRSGPLIPLKDWVIDENNLNRVKPISYSQFVPNFRAVYIPEENNTTGTTDFKINSSVQIRPVYTNDWYKVLWRSYEGIEREDLWKTVADEKEFTVNWNHMVFLGGRPVTLQLNDSRSCINVIDSRVNNIKCDYNDIKQSFFYDRQFRYISATDISMCLDAADLTKLIKCSGVITQGWKWEKKGEDFYLYNNYKDKVLTYNKQNGSLRLADSLSEIPDGYSANLGTVFTTVIK